MELLSILSIVLQEFDDISIQNEWQGSICGVAI